MSETERPVLAAVRNHIGHLTLNRPAGLNAVNLEMVRLLDQQLRAWAVDPAIHAVVLRANGEKAFCAGGDIRSLYDSFKRGDTEHETFFEEEYALDQYIHAYPKPLLALMDGFVLGGGMGLVQGAALRVITERVRMGMPEVGIGYFPDVGGSYFLSRLPGELGTYMGVTGLPIRAADALHAGLADWCISHEQIAELDRCLDHMSWSIHPQEALRTLVATLGTNRLPGSELKALHQAIDEHFGQHDVAAIRASLAAETRSEFSDWAEETLKVLDSRSPLAMCVTREMLRRGRDLPLAECFALELHLDHQWFAQGDIMEGVRALIIDKDKSPRWNPPTLAEVTPERVQAFFAGFKTVSGKTRRSATA
ncbi:enoyl-CoA hydratase/isomerase family protein [Pseudomonas phenolilytica]|uniref:enoyl-CoA hydratase/isomerase family protein n=1 Tax=Pseudomonas phenolilytica TaxID=2746321 RepID=UPI001F1D7E1F|nr:enoyl-CoA hydratase/isomerase family protein [Pseudomonas phenolilytica]UIP87518.1 enoyl-CoA hydratase/isomerase family protein [Pseudomonas phenolilytica]